MSHPSAAAEGQDAQQFFAVAETLAEESRRDVVADIVAHPEGLPSMKELEFTTGLHRTTIHQHLEALIDGGIVEPVEIPPGQQTKGQPRKFYAITDTARQIFDQNNIFIEDHWKEIYDRVEKPEEIQEAEAAPRPDQD